MQEQQRFIQSVQTGKRACFRAVQMENRVQGVQRILALDGCESGEMETGVANVNEANTTYNQSKGNALSVQGRYGEIWLVVLSVVLSLFRVLRRNGFHGDNNTDFSAIMLNLYGMTVPRFANHVLLSM